MTRQTGQKYIVQKTRLAWKNQTINIYAQQFSEKNIVHAAKN